MERFLGMNSGPHHWPTFNVADIAIVVGVLLMALDTFSGHRARAFHEPTTPPSSGHPPEVPITTAAPMLEPLEEAPGSVLEAMPKE